MNSLIKMLVGVIALVVPTAALHAQTASDNDRPAAPFVAPVPNYFQWTITITDKSRPEKPPRAPSPQSVTGPSNSGPAPGSTPEVSNENLRPTKILCTKTGDLKCDVIFFNNGKRSEIWYVRGMVMQKSSSGEIMMDGAHGSNAAMFVSKLSAEGFLDVDWVTADKFAGRQKSGEGADVYIYRDSNSVARSQFGPTNMPEFARALSRGAPKPEKLEAVVDVKTSLPLSIKRGEITYVYSYQPPPTQMLELPPTFQTKLTETDKREKSVDALRALIRR